MLVSCVYGDTHPYGHLAIGSQESLGAISREDAVNFYRANFAPNNAALILVGDLTEDDARRLANEAFGEWSGQAKPSSVPPAPRPISNRLVIVDKPGSPQTALLVAQPAVRRSDPDFDRLSVMNAVLGGNFAGRLNMNLREDKGYTYGSYSWLGEERGVSTLGCWASVRTDVSGAAIAEILKEYGGMSTRPPSVDELSLAKESLTQTLPAKFQTSDDLVGTIGQLYLLDLAPDYYQSLPARLASMTAADVTAIAGKYVDPTRLIVIAVGDRGKIEAQIGELNLGSVAYRAADRKPVNLN
ncbi:MAG: pitrilysin family protein [Candidatus Eisenbacteria bacterium]